MKRVLVTGANMENKGAQSMLFVAVDELRKRYKDVQVYFGYPSGSFNEEKYNFKGVYYTESTKRIALGQHGFFNYMKLSAKDCAKWILGKRTSLWKAKELKTLMSKMDMILDVSGFQLGDKWDIATNEGFLNNIRLAKKYNIPIYLMPQSFGPFEYKDKAILKEIEEELKYPEIIFAREIQGKEMLESQFGLTNVKLYSDLVLQNVGINPKNIYEKDVELHYTKISGNGNIGIVPNTKCLKHGNEEKIYGLYTKIMDTILAKDKKIYLFTHSSEDMVMCEHLKNQYKDNENVILITEEMTCLEYDEFVNQLDFQIGSRFHGLVHAFRNCVPCIALGWAVKYDELCKIVGEEGYSFDINHIDENTNQILEKVEYLMEHYETEKKVIEENMEIIRNDNCFSYVTFK